MLEDIEYIRVLVSKGDTEEAIKKLSNLVKNNFSELRNQALVLSSRLGSENRNRRLGLEFDKQEIAQINLGILEILDDVEEKVKTRIMSIPIEVEGGDDVVIEKNKPDLENIRPLLEQIKDIIIESLLLANVEITKIRAKILDDNFQYWEAVVDEESRTLRDEEEVLSRIFYSFYQLKLNILNFAWESNKISLNVYIMDGEIGFFELNE